MEVRLDCTRGPCEGRSITLGPGAHSIGRATDNAVCVSGDDAASARHATLEVRPGAILVKDQASHNGTFLNGVRLEVPTVLTLGDLLRIGASEWELHPALNPETATDEPQPVASELTTTNDLPGPRLQVLNGPQAGSVFELEKGSPFVVGRGTRADFMISDDPYVSREHATFFRQGTEIAVLDNESSNGVTVNGTKVRMIHLADGDEVQIGRTRFRYIGLGSPVPPLPTDTTGTDPTEGTGEKLGSSTEEPPSPAEPPSAGPGGQPLGRFGPYLLAAEVGRGGMGRVFAARAPGEEPVALKVMLLRGLDETRIERRRRRFEREVAVLRRVHHENVVGFRDSGLIEGRPYLAMELLRGPDLASQLRRGSQLPYPEIERILFQLCAAVSAVHEAGIIHRDLKPANVVLHGPTRVVKLTDFGIARPLGESDLEGDEEQLRAQDDLAITGAGRHPGTPLYMAPEQVRAEGFDMRSDIWALGVVLYQLVSGRRPFEGVTGRDVMRAVEVACPAPLADDVPGYVRSAVYRCLLKPPGWRFASAIELMDALHERRIEQPLPVGLDGPPKVPLSQCPYCRARIAAGRPRCPICQSDLHLFNEGHLLLVELDRQPHVCCGGCGLPVGLDDINCRRCGRPFKTRRSQTTGILDENLSDAEAEALALGMARLKQCPACGVPADARQPSCPSCGLLLRAHLVGRIKLAADEQGRERALCGHCQAPLPSNNAVGCPACGLDFITGKLRDGRVWHALGGEKGRRGRR